MVKFEQLETGILEYLGYIPKILQNTWQAVAPPADKLVCTQIASVQASPGGTKLLAPTGQSH